MRLRLGDLTFDPDARQLLRGREEVHLSPKAFELLKLLIDAASARAVEERAARAAVAGDVRLRNEPGQPDRRDSRGAAATIPRQPRFIRTAHRFGYAFCGSVADGARRRSGRRCHGVLLADQGRQTAAAPTRREHPGPRLRRRDPARFADGLAPPRAHLGFGGGASLEDLGSKNGTHLRGEPVTGAVALTDGDEIRVGSVVLRFRTASGRGRRRGPGRNRDAQPPASGYLIVAVQFWTTVIRDDPGSAAGRLTRNRCPSGVTS